MAQLPYRPCREEFSVDDNPYQNIYVDLTHRCNMDCNYCYNPLRARSDMDLGYFEEACRRLPQPVSFKFLGGEPTLHPRLFDFIRTGRRYGHHVYFSSNGIKYNDKSFMAGLAGVDVSFSPGLSMDGGTGSDLFYRLLNNRSCLDFKLRALENLHRHGIRRVALAAIIVRGVNEQVVGELIELADRYREVVRYIHFRSAAMVGRWVDTEPYSAAELKALMQPYYSEPQLSPRCLQEIHCGPDEGGECCYRFRPRPRLQVSLVEFASPRSIMCPKRGKLLEDGFRIQPYFENMVNTGEVLAAQFGEVVPAAV